MNQINDRPNQYDFGLEFNYALWTPGTELSLVNVPWNSDYRDIVRFADRNALDAYIDSREPAGIVLDNVSYVKFGQPVRIDVPINRVMRYNYIRASNDLQPIPGNDIRRNYYYFILDVRYVAPNTTELILQLDAVQNFIYDLQFGKCYVERGHIGIANENQFNNYGRDYLTVPEGLDIGADYRVIVKRTEEVISVDPQDMSSDSYADVMVVSTIDLEQDPGDVNDPAMDTTGGSSLNFMPSGAGIYVFSSVNSFTNWLNGMKIYPWMTQGIVSVTLIPKLTRYNPDFVYAPHGTPTKVDTYQAYMKKHTLASAWRDQPGFLVHIPERYRHLRKLFTSPYMVIEMTTWSGTPIVLRPEAWNHPDAHVMERVNYMPPNQRVQFIPRSYNSSGQNPENFAGLTDEQLDNILGSNPEQWMVDALYDIGDDYGDYLDLMTQIAGFPSLPVVNNMAISYLASNAHSIAYQRRSADWSQQRALYGADTAYNQAQRAMETAYTQYQIGLNADVAQTGNQNRTQAAQAVVNGIGGLVGNVAAGATGGAAFGPAGAAAGAAAGALSGAINGITNGINTGIGIAANDEALAIRNLAASSTIQNQNAQAAFVADTNLSYANIAAKGDYANAIAGINAKVQDAEMVQPSISGQFGGDAVNIAHGTMELSVRWKLIDNAAMRVVCEYWLRYGYAVRSFVQPPSSLMVMSKFTYWKMLETYIISSTVPESFKQTIRGIFEKGVTVWANPSYIGQTDWADNEPLPGISY